MGEQLSGKVVLVTGGSSGIGRAMARAVAAAGARVALVGRSENRLDAVASEIGDGALALAADLTKPKEVDLVVSAWSTPRSCRRSFRAIRSPRPTAWRKREHI